MGTSLVFFFLFSVLEIKPRHTTNEPHHLALFILILRWVFTKLSMPALKPPVAKAVLELEPPEKLRSQVDTTCIPPVVHTSAEHIKHNNLRTYT